MYNFSKRKRKKKKEKMYVVSLGLAAGRKICKKTSGRGEGIPTGERPPPSEKEFQVSVDGTRFFSFLFLFEKEKKKKSHFLFYCIDHTNQIDRISLLLFLYVVPC
jgi:hypothetical protein